MILLYVYACVFYLLLSETDTAVGYISDEIDDVMKVHWHLENASGNVSAYWIQIERKTENDYFTVHSEYVPVNKRHFQQEYNITISKCSSCIVKKKFKLTITPKSNTDENLGTPHEMVCGKQGLTD